MADEREAKEFAIGLIILEADREGVPLSEKETELSINLTSVQTRRAAIRRRTALYCVKATALRGAFWPECAHNDMAAALD